MRKLVSLLGIFAVFSMYVTAAMAGPVIMPFTAGTTCAVPSGNCGESDLVPSTGATRNAANVTQNVDWMVLDISGAAGTGITPNGDSYRINWESLVTHPAYAEAQVQGAGDLAPVASFAPYPTLYAYLYQPENVLTGNNAAMQTFGVQFSAGLADIVAAGVLYANPDAPVPNPQSVPTDPGTPPTTKAGIAELNAVDNFNGRVDDLDRLSNYHPGHISNSCLDGLGSGTTGVTPVGCVPIAQPAQGGVLAGVPLEEEGPRPTDGACPGPIPGGFFTSPGEFCEAAGRSGYTTVVTPGGGLFVQLFEKPSRHETPTIYILSPRPPVPGIGALQSIAFQYTSGAGATNPSPPPADYQGDFLPVPAAAIPEPGTFLLIGTGIACLLGQALRRKLKA